MHVSEMKCTLINNIDFKIHYGHLLYLRYVLSPGVWINAVLLYLWGVLWRSTVYIHRDDKPHNIKTQLYSSKIKLILESFL